MHLHELFGPWLDHPFWRARFLLAEITELVWRNPGALVSLARLKTHDEPGRLNDAEYGLGPGRIDHTHGRVGPTRPVQAL